MDKRIVLTLGGSDITGIVGLIPDGKLPPEILMLGEAGEIPCGLIRVTSRAAHYRQMSKPESGKFNEFHPEQK